MADVCGVCGRLRKGPYDWKQIGRSGELCGADLALTVTGFGKDDRNYERAKCYRLGYERLRSELATAKAELAEADALLAEREELRQQTLARAEKAEREVAHMDEVYAACVTDRRARVAAATARIAELEGFLSAAQAERDRWRKRYGEAADSLHDVSTRPQEAMERARRWRCECDHEHEGGQRSEEYRLIDDLLVEIDGARGVASGFVNGVTNELRAAALLAAEQLNFAAMYLVEPGPWLAIAALARETALATRTALGIGNPIAFEQEAERHAADAACDRAATADATPRAALAPNAPPKRLTDTQLLGDPAQGVTSRAEGEPGEERARIARARDACAACNGIGVSHTCGIAQAQREDPEASPYPSECAEFVALGEYATRCGQRLARPGGDNKHPYYCGKTSAEHAPAQRTPTPEGANG